MEHPDNQHPNNVFHSLWNQSVFGFTIPKIKLLLTGVVFLLFSTVAFSQGESDAKKNDSVHTSLIREFNRKLSVIDGQRIKDSIKKVELETKLLSLKTTDNLKKEDLEKQLLKLQGKDSLRLAQKKVQIDLLRMTSKGYPVTGFFNDTIFIIYSKLGSFSAKDRADAISFRIKNLADKLEFDNDSITIAEAETTSDLVNKESIIMSISENDALWNN
ncbi:MAG: hypothetical protein QMA99_02985, partial [Flavobacterium sp.]